MPSWEINFDPRINLRDEELLSLCVEIEAHKLSVLKLPVPPGMRKHLNRINIVRQLKGTTGIEGNTLSEGEIESLISVTDVQQDQNLEEREVLNAYQVLNFVSKLQSEGIDILITEELVKDLHRLNTLGCDYADNIPGEYRRTQVVAGNYRPPEPGEVPGLMKRFVEFINSREVVKGLKPLIRAILAYFYLVSIHPFADGNGRTSRALEACVLYHSGYNIYGFYSLANFYYKNRSEYIKQLQDARFRYDGDLNAFVKFALRGFLSELTLVQEEILDYIRKVIFTDYLMELQENDVINWRIFAIMQYLLKDRPFIGLEEFKGKRHHVVKGIYENYKGNKTLLRDLKIMEDHRLVVVENGKIKPNIKILDSLSRGQ